MYDPKSLKAEEFICHEEIEDTLKYADENKDNMPLIREILDKARLCKGLSHREASVLLACEDPEILDEIYKLANEIKHKFYGNRIVMFAPLYLSNYCVNGCIYCPYHRQNHHIPRRKLTQEEVAKEVIALQDMGHKRLAIEAGEDPVNNPIEYILDCIKTIYSIQHKNGAIRRVNVNIAATTVENYRKLREAGIGTYILFQETYHKESYEKLHPTGPKHNYAYHTEAMDRAMEGGIDDVLTLTVDGEQYALPVRMLLQGTRIYAQYSQCERRIIKKFGPTPHYRDDFIWHCAFKFRVRRAVPSPAYTLNESFTTTLDAGSQYRLRVWLKNGDAAWTSPIFCR